MRKALTAHLPPASPEEAVETAEAVADLRESHGWGYVTEAVNHRREALYADLINKGVRDSVGDYERIVGEMRGLESLEAIIEGLIVRPARMEPEEVAA